MHDRVIKHLDRFDAGHKDQTSRRCLEDLRSYLDSHSDLEGTDIYAARLIAFIDKRVQWARGQNAPAAARYRDIKRELADVIEPAGL